MSLITLQGNEEKQKGIYYQVESTVAPIGVGGMGQVYKGLRVEEHTGITRPVAIKFLYSDLPPRAIERARREAEIQLRNDNLIEMLGFIETDEVLPSGAVLKHYHVVSELLTGVSLSDVLEGKTKDRDGNDVPFVVKMLQDYRNDPSHFARTIIMGVLSGLLALHDAGYIHRDIDPSNIMLTDDGHIKLIDFGIAKKMNDLTTSDQKLTETGVFMGKPEYAAPELAKGDIKRQNQTTDIYAMGILLYQCIVGHTPFEGPRHEILEKQIKAKLPLGVIKDRGLRNIIAIACDKQQEFRYQSAAQMRVALENWAGSRRAIPPIYKYAAIGGCAAILVLVIVLAVGIKHHQKETLREMVEQQERDMGKQAVERLRKQIQTISEEASEKMMIGQNYDADDYENHLMRAYLGFEEAEELAMSVDTLLVDSIRQQKALVMTELDAAIVRFQEQRAEAAAFNLPDTAIYSRRANAVIRFKKEHN